MLLNFEQIKSITQGAETVEQEKQIVNFYRFTDEERAIYSKTVFRQKAFATAGIRMEFETVSEENETGKYTSTNVDLLKRLSNLEKIVYGKNE